MQIPISIDLYYFIIINYIFILNSEDLSTIKTFGAVLQNGRFQI